MPLYIATACLMAALAVDVTLSAWHFVHMLQLNSYRPERYGRWLRGQWGSVLGRMGWLLLAVIAAAAGGLAAADWIACAAAAVVLILHIVLTWPGKAKTPLVVTARVARLFVTHSVLLVGVVLAVCLTGLTRIGLAGLLLFAALMPLITLLCCLINQPFEAAVARHYVRDAKTKLAAMPGLVTIGVTGSYGKTSVKHIVTALLSVRYNVLMTPGSYNTTLGVVRTIREQLRPTHEIFVAEMGAKQPGDIRELCDLVSPRYGVITAVGEQHLETFHTLDAIVRTKFELADALPCDGAVFLNVDNEPIRSRAVSVPAVTYGLYNDAAQYRAVDVEVDTTGSRFTVTAPDGETARFATRLLGAHAIVNIMGGIAVAHTLGVPLADLVAPVKRLKPVPHRLELLPGGIIDDAYNSNPAGFRAALEVLRGFDGQRVLVTPGMVELGDQQEALNRELGALAASCCDYAVLVGERQAPPLREGLLSAGFAPDRLYVAKDLQDGLQYVQTLPPDPGRIVLLENDLPDNF